MGATIKELARDHGVVGAGGAGFPTHVKLDAQVDTLIVNGAECEPLITVDQVLLLTRARELAETLEHIRLEVGAREAVIAIKEKHAEVIAAAEAAVSGRPSIRVHALEDRYPAGDEYVLVYEVTGRLIPHSGLPLQCGVMVLNVETLWNLHEAEQGRSVTKKWVTVAGEAERPGTYLFPIGISEGEAVSAAGAGAGMAIIDGGPMMGRLKDASEPVTKTTKALLVLPQDSPVVQNRRTPMGAILRQARSVCCQCHLCTDLCPRHLLGYSIEPNKTILAASYSWALQREAIPQAYLCSECGACDTYACPMGLSPRRVNQMLKGLLAQENVPNPYKGREAAPRDERAYRRIPTKRLMSRLGLDRYESPAELREHRAAPSLLTLPLRQHAGAPSVPVVRAGSPVEEGGLVAEIPEGALGSRIFASAAGVVAQIRPDAVVIRVGGNA